MAITRASPSSDVPFGDLPQVGDLIQLSSSYLGADLIYAIAKGRANRSISYPQHITDGATTTRHLYFAKGFLQWDAYQPTAGLHPFLWNNQAECRIGSSTTNVHAKLVDPLSEILASVSVLHHSTLEALLLERDVQALQHHQQASTLIQRICHYLQTDFATLTTIEFSKANLAQKRALLTLSVLCPHDIRRSIATETSTSDDTPRLSAEIQQAAEHILNASNAYEAFRVAPNASTQDIENSYRWFASRLHPDRHPRQIAHHSLLKDAFAKLSDIYSILSDTTRREAYDFKHKRESKGQVTDPEIITQAERRFRTGRNYIEHGQIEAALVEFEWAAQHVPEEWVYQGYQAYAQGMLQPSRRDQYIQRLEAVIDEKPKDVEILLLYADLLRVDNKIPLAEQAYQAVIRLDSQNHTAQRALRLFQKSR